MLRLLTWNLYHGRSRPPTGRDGYADFAGALAGWPWDVALLQEVPPWWAPGLAAATGARGYARVLTSRNALPAVRRAVAVRRPDLIKSNGGGANVILVRGEREAREHHIARLRRLPERRWVHAVRLGDGTWIGNLHAQGTPAEARRAAMAMNTWAGPLGPAALGGDFNLAAPSAPGFSLAGGQGVDLFLVRGFDAVAVEVLERGTLSDHAPVAVTLRPA